MTPEEHEAIEREWVETIKAMAADPGCHAELCRVYCHEGLQVLACYDDPGRGRVVEIGICSHAEAVIVPAGTTWKGAEAYLSDPAILARLAEHIRSQAVEHDALGC